MGLSCYEVNLFFSARQMKKKWPHAAILDLLFSKFDWQSVDGSKKSINWKIDDLMPYIDIA